MINYRNNQTPSLNPWARAFAKVDTYSCGIGVLGAMTAMQHSTGYTGAGGGYNTILTEVIDWPFSADDQGVAFDQANLYGVRTRCWSDPAGGEVDWWTAVPKILPSGYTDAGRCTGRIVPLIQDFLGFNPMLGIIDQYSSTAPVYWRTPTSDAFPVNGYLWVPMNLNQQTLHITDGSSGFYWQQTGLAGVTATAPSSACYPGGWTAGPNTTRTWYVAQTIARHVGFRGGKLVLEFFSTGSYPCGIYMSGTIRVVLGWDPSTAPMAYPNLPANIMYDHSFQFSDLVNLGSDGVYYFTRYQLTVDLPAMLVTPKGTNAIWNIMYGSQFAGDGPMYFREAFLSPRTDVPLWYFASTGNKCAPGGYIP